MKGKYWKCRLQNFGHILWLKGNGLLCTKKSKQKKQKQKTTIILAVILHGVTDVQGNENEWNKIGGHHINLRNINIGKSNIYIK